MTNVKNIEQIANNFNNDVNELNKELKRLASAKCRLLKNKFQPNYEQKLNDILAQEQVIKEAKNLLNPREKFVTEYEQADVDRLDYDETVKALKSIQSKKTNTMYLTPTAGDNDEFRNACRIEAMLQQHRETVKPVEDAYIRRTDLQAVINTIESSGELTQERILELLKSL